MSHKQKGLGRQVPQESRGGGRDRRDMDRNLSKKARRSRSRSPIKSKLMAMAMSNAAKAKAGEKGRRDSSRERDVGKRKLRMDELNDKRERALNKTAHRSPERKMKSETGPKKKTTQELYKVVKKAREERNPYWDKKVLEAEEKDPQRWGHSGFKELYQKDFKRRPSSPKRHRRSRSRSMSSPRRNSSPRFLKRSSRSRSPSRRSRSRSRSPLQRKGRKGSHRSYSPSPEFMPSKAKGSGNRTGLTKSKGNSDLKSKGRSSGEAGNSKPGGSNSQNTGLKGKVTSGRSGNGTMLSSMKARLGHRVARRSSSFSSTDSSRSGSSRGFSPPKRPTGIKTGLKGNASRNTRGSSETSSSNSSEDEDVLQLHAGRKGRSPSLSYSDTGSSTSSRSIRRNRKGPRSSSSSSMSGSSSDSESDASIGTKPTPQPPPVVSKPGKPGGKIVKKPTGNGTAAPKSGNAVAGNNNKAAANKKPTPPVHSDSDSSASNAPPLNKAPPKVLTKGAKKALPPVTIKQSTKTGTASGAKSQTKAKTAGQKGKSGGKSGGKSVSESGETESETDSSSDSDSEPRMTLSERFAKLAQMGTDKREMAKPVLAVNEIDTKMRVVKDLRNPEAPKTYVTGQGPGPDTRTKMRPKTPPQYPAEGDKRYSSDERRRHFERMYRDEPAERPLDWSDARVRYNYYKDRGCFDERPITFDEYVKWEDWYQKYREWLEREEYYSRMAGPPPQVDNYPGPSGPPPFGPGGRGGGGGRGGPNYPMGRRVGGPPMPLSNRAHFGRPDSNGYTMDHGNLGRRIDRTAGGSLVVNIRPSPNNNFIPRGVRRGGMIRQR